MSRNTPQNRAVNRAIFAAKDNTGLPISTWPKYSSITNKTMSTWPDGETTMYINNNKDSIGLDGTIYNNSGKVIGNDGIITTASKPAQNKGTQGKPAGTKGNSSKGGTRGSKGNVRTTAKPAATTTTTTPTVTPASTENTGNYTIQRGDTLGALAKRFGMSVDELARLNNISNPNRIYAGRTLITKAPTVETPDIKIETPSVPNYGYGVTDSNLKLGTN
jgi:LysM repeat protein